MVTDRQSWRVVVAPAALAASLFTGARSCLILTRFDGVFDAPDSLGLMAGAHRFAVGFALTFPLAALVAALYRWLERRDAGLVSKLALVVASTAAGFAFVSCRLPDLPVYRPDFLTTRGSLANVAAGGAALFASLALWPWVRPALVRLGAAASVPLLAAAVGVLTIGTGAPAGWPERPNVILISMDTVRADRLGCYGHPDPTTPELDRFAEQGLLFTQAYSQDAWTLTSHMTMLTSLHPTVHGVDREHSLSSNVRTLAEVLLESGYRTMAIVDRCVWLAPSFGFDRGFEIYRQVARGVPAKTREIQTLLDEIGSSPFFLFAHFYDAHSDTHLRPYESSPEDYERFAGWYDGDFDGCDEEGNCASEFLENLNRSGRTLPEEETRYLADTYRAGIRTLDRQMGRFLDALEERGLFENSLILITADHGEEFFEHGRSLHDQYYEECLHVPLILRTPETTGTTSDDLVGLVDLMPTVLDVCGVASPELQGRSLLGAKTPTDRPAFVVADGYGAIRALRTREWSMVREDDRWRLYSASSDPGQTVDLSLEENALQASELLKLLELTRAEFSSFRDRYGPAASHGAMNDDQIEDLKKLGYLGE